MTTTLGPTARLRLLRRAVAVLADSTTDQRDPVLEHTARALAERGIAATARHLGELIDERAVLTDLEQGGTVDQYIDLDRWYGPLDEAREYITGRVTRQIRHLERLMCGV